MNIGLRHLVNIAMITVTYELLSYPVLGKCIFANSGSMTMVPVLSKIAETQCLAYLYSRETQPQIYRLFRVPLQTSLTNGRVRIPFTM